MPRVSETAQLSGGRGGGRRGNSRKDSQSCEWRERKGIRTASREGGRLVKNMQDIHFEEDKKVLSGGWEERAVACRGSGELDGGG